MPNTLAIFQPVLIGPPTQIIAGQNFSCQVETDGAPVSITIYSSPSGVVAYSGTIPSTTETLTLSCLSTAAAGTITLYLETDGTTTVSAQTEVKRDSAPGGGPGS